MDQTILDYIKDRTKADKKTLAQKLAYTTRELGELAGVILPFENADATAHKYTEKNQILDEVADVMLGLYSIAYDLGFSDEELSNMLMEKAAKWQQIQSINQVEWPLPYEIHVTIKSDGIDFDHFKRDCHSFGVKALSLELITNNGNFCDFETSSKHIGNNTSVKDELDNIRWKLTSLGYTVIREKIETVPWHPAAKHFDTIVNAPHFESSYYEAHFELVVNSEQFEQVKRIVANAKRHSNLNLSISRNTQKIISYTHFKIMVTYRDSKTSHEFERNKANWEWLLKQQFPVEKTFTEFTISDTNPTHDDKWIKKPIDREAVWMTAPISESGYIDFSSGGL